ncbi:heme-binding protein [Oceanimonas baumannii]|uniref:GlcG/HbpS family heme-binding protein n=1 Tax=Oceanimonas TaxID=129577 RepID=UPI001D17F5AB|nr:MULTISPECIES: heme-binding protein [Oceanimonas]MCC4263280.1 heme-binding protein [Oceanimonas baumannii]MDV2856342.1 heme-binding protein [Oceanimonas sp. CAM02]
MNINFMTWAGVTLSMAEHIAEDGGRPLCFAIVDSSGSLVHLYRMNDAPQRLVTIAMGKAYSSSRMEMPTALFRQRLLEEQLSLGDFKDDGLTSLPGGQPLFDDGKLIGAVGVSGRTLEEDEVLSLQFAQRIQAAL